MHNFDFVKPSSVADAVRAMSAEGAQALSGGQTLLPTMKQRLAAPAVLVSLTGIADTRGVCLDNGALSVGGATAHVVVASEARKYYPALADLAGGIGDPAVRSRGTIGGSLANNDPSADYPAAVLALGGSVKTTSRTIAADDYFKGMFETALEEGEIITEISFPVPEKAAYMKFPNPASRYAMVGVFVAKLAAGVRVAVTGAASSVFREKAMEAALTKSFTPDAIAGIKVSPSNLNSDLHATAEYRAHLVTVMAKRAVAAALA